MAIPPLSMKQEVETRTRYSMSPVYDEEERNTRNNDDSARSYMRGCELDVKEEQTEDRGEGRVDDRRYDRREERRVLDERMRETYTEEREDMRMGETFRDERNNRIEVKDERKNGYRSDDSYVDEGRYDEDNETDIPLDFSVKRKPDENYAASGADKEEAASPESASTNGILSPSNGLHERSWRQKGGPSPIGSLPAASPSLLPGAGSLPSSLAPSALMAANLQMLQNPALMAAAAGASFPFMIDPRQLLQQQQQQQEDSTKKKRSSLPLPFYGMPSMVPYPGGMDHSALSTMNLSSEEMVAHYRQQIAKVQETSQDKLRRASTHSERSDRSLDSRSGGQDIRTSQDTRVRESMDHSRSLDRNLLKREIHEEDFRRDGQERVRSDSDASSPSSSTDLMKLTPPNLMTHMAAMNAGSSTSQRRKPRLLPEDKKDVQYWDRRRKNNAAAKRSRDVRRAKEDEIAIRAAFLEQENLKLRVEVAALKNETAKLRCMLYNS